VKRLASAPRLALLSALCLAGCHPSSSAPAPPEMDPLPLPDFTLTERGGRPMGKAELKGKVWVASFVFTRCNGPCPSVTATMARLQTELAGQPDFRLVTITVDPERDRRKDLDAYAERFRADPARWFFLTGDRDEIYRLLREGFKVPVEPASQAGGDDIGHSTRLVLVDRKGRIRGYYQGLMNPEMPDGERSFEDDLRRLRDKAAALAREAP
jgi:cytochrome oxidase Cu insertion factor (SCO1/SenC/PrrC family)